MIFYIYVLYESMLRADKKKCTKLSLEAIVNEAAFTRNMAARDFRTATSGGASLVMVRLVAPPGLQEGW